MNIFTLISGLALLAITVIPPALASDVTSDITIVEHSAWVRATPPGAKTTAIYLSLENHSDTEINLVAAKSNISKRLELHTHLQEDGMMKMRQVDSIIAAPGGIVDLKPHGLHIMVFNVSETLKEGDSVALTLQFENRDNLELTVPVSKKGPSSKDHHKHADHKQKPAKHSTKEHGSENEHSH